MRFKNICHFIVDINKSIRIFVMRFENNGFNVEENGISNFGIDYKVKGIETGVKGIESTEKGIESTVKGIESAKQGIESTE